MKDYLSFEGLSHFFRQLLTVFARKEDVVTNEEISEICESIYMELDKAASAVRVSDIELLAANWVGTESPYSQVVNIEGITDHSQVDLKPSIEQLAIFYDKDLAFVTENENGIVTVYALGDKPLNDYTIQVSITEVTV